LQIYFVLSRHRLELLDESMESTSEGQSKRLLHLPTEIWF
jgi:hypothetical protein